MPAMTRAIGQLSAWVGPIRGEKALISANIKGTSLKCTKP